MRRLLTWLFADCPAASLHDGKGTVRFDRPPLGSATQRRLIALHIAVATGRALGQRSDRAINHPRRATWRILP